MAFEQGSWNVHTSSPEAGHSVEARTVGNGKVEWKVDGYLVETQPRGGDATRWGIAVNAWQQAVTNSFNDLNSDVRDLQRDVRALRRQLNALTKPLAKAPPARRAKARSPR